MKPRATLIMGNFQMNADFENFADSENTHETKQHKSKIESRRQAPVEFLVPNKDLDRLKYERKMKYEQSQYKNTDSGLLPLNEQARETKNLKAQARVHFKARTAVKMPPGVNNWKEVSPILDLRKPFVDPVHLHSADAALGYEHRVLCYSRTHKCAHNRHFNSWSVQGSVLVPMCDHEYETITEVPGPSCPNCARKTYKIKRACLCEAFACSRCKQSFYPHSQWIESKYFEPAMQTVYKNYDLHRNEMWHIVNNNVPRPAPVNKPVLNPWKKVDGEAQFGFSAASSIVSSATQAFKSHLCTIVNSIKDFFSSMLRSTVNNALLTWIKSISPLNFILEFISGFLEFTVLLMTEFPLIALIDLYHLFQHVPKYAIFRFFHYMFTYLHTYITRIDPTLLPGLKSNVNGVIQVSTSLDNSITSKLKSMILMWRSDITYGDYLCHIWSIFFPMEPGDYPTVNKLYSELPSSSHSEFEDSFFSVRRSSTPPRKQHSKRSRSSEPFSQFEFEPHSSNYSFLNSLMKSVTLFSKEFLPVFSIINSSTSIIERLPRMITKLFSCFTQTTQQWLECEIGNPDSPLSKYLDCSFCYWQAHLLDDSKRCTELAYDGRKLASEAISYCKTESHYDTFILRWFSDIEKVFSHPRVPGVREHEPFCIRMVGAPGAGKSTTYRSLIAPIFGAKTKSDVDNLCFIKGTSEYWDGCIDRPVVVFDDFAQNRKEETDVLDMITLVSDAPFMPNFANMSGSNPKGSTYDPKIIVACTNATSDDGATSIRCPKALSRRFHLVIEVRLVKNVRKYKIVLPENNPQQFESTKVSPTFSSLFTDYTLPIPWPRSEMTLLECQEFVYKTYKIFLESRKEGVAKAESSYVFNHPPLLAFSAGSWVPEDSAIPHVNPSHSHNFVTYQDPSLLSRFKAFFTVNKLAPINLTLSIANTFLDIVMKIAMAWFAFDFFRKMIFPSPNQSIPNSSVAKGKVAPPRVTVQHFDPEGLELQASDNISDMLTVIQKNTATISVENRSVNCLFIAGTYVLTVEHIFLDPSSHVGSYVPDGTPMCVELPFSENPVHFTFSAQSITPIKYSSSDSDAVIYKLPISKFNHHRNIINYFWDGSYAINNRKILATDYLTVPSPTFRIENSMARSFVEASYTVSGRVFNQRLAYGNYQGRKGQCGSPILDAVRSTAPILGIHVGKDKASDQGLFLLITRQLLEKHLPSTPLNRIVMEPHCQIDFNGTERGSNHVSGSMELIGTMSRPVYSPTETTLKKSQLFDLIQPHVTEPSAISPKDPRIPPGTDLWSKTVSKLTQQMEPPTIDIFTESQNAMDELVSGMPYFGPQRILTLDEAINGSLDFPQLKTLDMSTSCGYPWVLNGWKKEHLFIRNEETGKLIPTDMFMTEYNKAWDMVSNNHVPDFVLLCALKDERRPIDKVKSAKTRLFTVAPLVMNVLLKQFYGPYANSLMENFREVSYAGKVDRLGSSWSTMMSGLFEKSPIGFGADFGSYDGRLEKSRMIRSMKRMLIPVKAVLSPLQLKMAEALIICVTEPWYAFEGVLVSVPGSLASGVWVTQFLGSDMTHTMLYEAWLATVPVEYRSMYHFKTFVSLRVMGDDHIVSVIPAMTKYYNGETVCDYFAKHKMEYTSPEKNGKPEATLPLTDISFLKNKTGSQWGMYIPLMEKQAALEPINWIRKHPIMTDDELTEVNANGSLRTVFFYGPEFFNQIRDAIKAAKPSYNLLTYGYLRATFQSYGTFPGAEHGEASFYDLTGLPTGNVAPSEEIVKLKNFSLSSIDADPQMDDQSNKHRFVIPTHEMFSGKNLIELDETCPFSIPALPPFDSRQPVISSQSLDPFTSPPSILQPLTSKDLSLDAINESLDQWERKISVDKVIRPPSSKYYCSFCLHQTRDENEFKQHLGSKKHKSTLLHQQMKRPLDLPSKISSVPLPLENSAKVQDLQMKDKPAVPLDAEKPFSFFLDHQMNAVKPVPTADLFCRTCNRTFQHQNPYILHLFAEHQVDYPVTNVAEAIDYSPLPVIRTTITQLELALQGIKHSSSTPLGNKIISCDSVFGKACLHRMQTYVHHVNAGRISEYFENMNARKELPVPNKNLPSLSSLFSEVKTDLNQDEFLKSLEKIRLNTQSKLITIPSSVNVEPQAGDPHSNVPETTPLTTPPQTSAPEQNAIIDDPVNEVSNASNQLGWTNREKNELELVSPAGLTEPISGARAESALNDISWSLEKVLMRWNQVGVYKWNLTDAVGATLANLDVIQDLLTTSVVSMPFTNFEKFRCSVVRFKFILVGSKFHQGRLLCGFLPTMAPKNIAKGDSSLKTLIEVGAVQLDPSSGSDVEYTVPWRHVKGYLDLISGDVLGNLRIVVLNQLRAVTGSSNSVNVKVLFRLENPEFKIPRPSVGTFYDMMSAHQALNSRFRSAEPHMNESPQTKNVASINDMSQNEALPIAPARATTADSDVSHFGEKYTTTRDIGKRYRPVLVQWQSIAHTPGEPIYGNAHIKDLLSYFPELRPFKLLRGGLNFKIFLSVTTNAAAGAPQFRVPYTLLITHNAPPNDAISFSPKNIGFSDGYMINPISRSDETSCAEFYIPFTQMSSTIFHPNAIDNAAVTNLKSEYSLNGELLFNIFCNTDSTQVAIQPELWIALSDEFAAGVFAGSPELIAVNTHGCGFTVSRAGEEQVVPTKPSAIRLFNDYRKMSFSSSIEVVPCGLDRLVDSVMKRVIPDNLIEDALGALLDKPEISNPPEIVKFRKSDYLNHAVGTQSIDKFLLYPAAQQTTDPEHFGSPRDEMDYRFNIKNRRCLVGTFSWLDTNVEGDVITSGLLGPFGLIGNPVGATAKKYSMIDYYARNFTFWRGGITLIFDVVTSAYHEGKLEVTFHPNALNAPATYDAKVSQYVVSSIIKNTENVFGVTFPFLSETPWKRVWNGFPLRENAVNNPSPNVQDYMLGYFTLVVAAPLRVPSTVAASVDVNVYIQAADDFEFNSVSMNGSWLRDLN